jgi:cytochrome c556
MSRYMQWGVVAAAAAVVIAVGGAGTLAQDKMAVVKERQNLMDQQSDDLKVINAYITGSGEQAAAVAKVQDLIVVAGKIGDARLWPAGTAIADLPEKATRAKPEIWQQMDKFSAIPAALKAEEEKVLAAVQKGDKDGAKTAIADMNKNGCGACHGSFRGPEIK